MQKKSPKFTHVPVKEKLAAITNWLLDKKAERTVSLDISGLKTFSDGIVIASASSVRHAQGLADHVLAGCKQENYEFLRVEGYTGGDWILLDLNDVLVNIFQRETRDLYAIEELWPSAVTVHVDK